MSFADIISLLRTLGYDWAPPVAALLLVSGVIWVRWKNDDSLLVNWPVPTTCTACVLALFLFYRYWGLPVIALALLFPGCSPTVEISETQALYQARRIEDPKQRIEAFRAFLEAHPDHPDGHHIFGQLFRDFLSLDEVDAALEAAEHELGLIPSEQRVSFYVSTTSLLAERGMGLDKALEYGSVGLTLARKEESRFLPRMLDAYALALHRSGDSEEAETLQLEAIRDNQHDFRFLRHLAWIQHANGKIGPALESLSESLLLRDEEHHHQWDLEDLDKFGNWLESKAPDPLKRHHLKTTLVTTAIEDYLANGETPRKKSESAGLLARTGVRLGWAETLGREALESLRPDSSEQDTVQFASNLARVLQAQNRSEEMLDVLLQVEVGIIWYPDYWLQLGRAYSSLKQNDLAIAALLTPLVVEDEIAKRGVGKLPVVRAELKNLGMDENRIASKIDRRKQQILDFHPGRYPGRVSGKGHVVLAELFTGSECRPCVAADLAFDLLGEHYPRFALAILEYHVHIPGADPMTNPHTERRRQFYGGKFGTPRVFVDGKSRMSGGGPALAKKDSFLRYRHQIEAVLDKDPSVELSVICRRQGESISVLAEIRSSQTIPKARIFGALVEKSVHYDQGLNGIEQHAFVVRHLMGDADGTPLGALEGGKLQQEVNLEEIEKGLLQYLRDFEENPPESYADFQGWEVKPVEMDANNLAVVVWVQNPETHEVYEARYSDIESR